MVKTKQVAPNLHLVEPRATEKTYREQTKRTYVFPVKNTTSKQEIVKLVTKEFNVTVTDVRTLIRKGKKTRYSKGKHAYPGVTFRQDKKYAYVTLKEGDTIKVFDEPNSQTTKPVKQSVKKLDKTKVSPENSQVAKTKKSAQANKDTDKGEQS